MPENAQSARPMLYLVYFIYFFCGLTQCFEGVFLPEFKEYFHLTYQQQMYTMFAKNIPFLLAVGIGALIRYTGYKNCMSAAMALFSIGTLVLIPGLQTGRYEIVLLGFFLIGLGFNCEIVAGNPMLSALGPAAAASSRLNLGNALGAVAQIIAPATVSLLIPVSAIAVTAKLPYIVRLFAVLGAVLAVVSIVTAVSRRIDIGAAFRTADAPTGGIWSHSRLVFGFVAISLVLGFEAGLFGFFRNYLEDPLIAGLSSHESQRLFTVFFAVFALGRLAASWIQTRIAVTTHLLATLAGSIVCLAVMVLAKGMVAVSALIAIGFFVSVLFPTLYSLAIENMGDLTAQASGLLTMGFVGCAILPVIQGRVADSAGLQRSYALGFVCYAVAALFTLKIHMQRSDTTMAFGRSA